MLVFVVDIDNTVADTLKRVEEINKKYNTTEERWGDREILEFSKPDAVKSDPIIPGAEIIAPLARICGAKLVFFTGRSEKLRQATRLWLANKLDIFDTVPLVMRSSSDYRSTYECKKDTFIKTIYQVYKEANFVFFEDNEKLLTYYSQKGLALKAPECWKLLDHYGFTV